MHLDEPHVVGFAVALGAGLLIGTERERHKGQAADREAAGLRSFTVAALSGAIAQALPSSGLVVVGACLVAGLSLVAFVKSRSADPGMTTELALFTTFLIGVLAIISPALAAGCAAGLALLLAAKERLHRFATELLSQQELHDGLLLAGLVLIVLPLIPAGPIGWLNGIAPRPLAALVVLILALQTGGQVALRALGVRAGLLVGGFVSGFVSSTATVASLGSRAKAEPAQVTLLACAAVLSAVATWLQALIMSVALAPSAAAALAPAALAGAVGAGAAGLMALRGTQTQAPIALAGRSALRLGEAFAVAALLGAVAIGVGYAQRFWGDLGLKVGVALAAIGDAHAPVASLAALHAAGTLADEDFVRGALLAVSINSVTRVAVAFVSGGPSYAWRFALALATSVAAAWASACSIGR